MTKISAMNLLSNDPAMAARVIESATKGDVDSQYAAGLICAEGRGVPRDLVQAWFWLTRAVDQGDRDAVRLRQIVAAEMNDREFEQAKHLLAVSSAGLPESGAKATKRAQKHRLH